MADADTPTKPAVAKLFMHGRSQAVRLPKQFRLPGTQVRVRKVPGGILLQPVYADPKEWFAAIDRAGAGAEFMPEGREQPALPPQKAFFD
jgi:antitoxin VapB